jgi:hypothetical protein
VFQQAIHLGITVMIERSSPRSTSAGLPAVSWKGSSRIERIDLLPEAGSAPPALAAAVNADPCARRLSPIRLSDSVLELMRSALAGLLGHLNRAEDRPSCSLEIVGTRVNDCFQIMKCIVTI